MSSVKHETSFVVIHGRKTQLTVGGEGPPLVYLHSAGGETDWMPFHEGLASRYKVYAPAHPGFALSGGLADIRDMSDLIWHYVDLFGELELEKAPIVGFSLGAWIAVELAILRPSLVDKLVLTAAAGLHVKDAPMAELFIDDIEKMKQLLFFDQESPSIKLVMPSSPEDPKLLMWLRAREATARVGWNPYLHNPRLPQHLHRVKAPALVLWGEEDRLIPQAHGEFYAEHLPSADLKVFESCGHMVPFEKCDEFVSSCLRFLSS